MGSLDQRLTRQLTSMQSRTRFSNIRTIWGPNALVQPPVRDLFFGVPVWDLLQAWWCPKKSSSVMWKDQAVT